MNDISIIILAAGNGTRMKSSKSKVLHELCGEPMITHILKKSYEITSDVRVVLSYQFEEVKSVVLAEFENTKICKQDIVNFPGTAGALRAAINDLNSKKTLIICGDMPLVQVDELKALCKNSSDVTLSAFKAIDPNGYGRVITKDKKVVKIVEQKDANEDEIKVDLCNAGAYCFDTNLLKDLIPLIKNNNASKEFYLTDAIELAINRGFSVSFSLVSEANFMGINDKFALSLAEEIMQNSIKEKLMKNGVIMHLPKTIFIDSRAKFEGECIIEPNVMIIGNSVIKNSVIKSGSVIEYSQVDSSDVGPMAHLRPNSKIQKTHIGNFVELKNANLDTVKAGHLSYLGDCDISSGTNIGCGTITCNYDGKKKHKTIIGKNVFIGSDTQLVAPLSIADDTLVAAGSTVTKNSSKGDLIITRNAQINKPMYFYKFFGKNDEK
ncbi:bifunctional UDP-N-acetylglucosamine diphosphorylase/glucosamine-1-phosphate N-acetyltransferase GlmU [Campylobacter hyointestinalis]|uniref:bifunctional UDP-N-acetylglucosamine diphosphorylase/glucosamine-1-phosphate N-acetyltransferase GlmU n=1 Tax=Campylobacter hyointestinalis TaxID=198 RepID=UPI000DCC9C4D|nr:bifunctional UDP-N-acetylglucosamine diphosphorylase/glucosamine-1-phosphate N-acetyltransferase GlmU [Campylobacter hyointestinalis]RAZ54062.1 bifunctional UDP-N-acetylglucosamine diphosphorylase/glucosamine-1-phosphate N-acetyltransferase GlmU [Campylobacter hyointestinalis subsp. lawsonii]RAZ64231.1 bifunctional UDP-N-acetylglucosamine diphosphorylase/glucosamine-1-phosphate N-acetyltransferase GlmU [Campylobacter hyointestinalis subsp. lawsonii]